MEYKIDDTGEKKTIKTILIILLIVSTVGICIFLYNNTKYIYLYNIFKVKTEITQLIKEESKFYNGILDDNIYSTIKITKKDSFGQEENTKIDINKNADNVYNALKINDMISLYEENGIFYVHIPNDNKLIKLNDESINFDNKDANTSKNISKIFKKISLKLVSELDNSDFYKLSYKVTDKKGRERTKYIHGFTLSEKRIQEICINVLEEVRDDKGLIKKISKVGGKEEKLLKEKINEIVESIKKYQANEDYQINIEMKTDGILNINPTEIKITIENNSLVLEKINMIVSKNSIVVTFPKYNSNENRIITLNYTDSRKEIGYEVSDIYGNFWKNSMILETYRNERKIKNSYMKNNFGINTETYIKKDIESNKITFNIDGTYGETENEEILNISGEISHESVPENVENYKVYSFNEILDQEKEYIRAYLADTWKLFQEIK